MSLQQILQKNREQIQKDYESILPAEQIQKTIEYWDNLNKELLQALYDEEEKEMIPLKVSENMELLQGYNQAKQDTLNRLKSLIDSL